MSAISLKSWCQLLLITGALLLGTSAQAQVPCNDIIDFDGSRSPITDCDNPFGTPSPEITTSLFIDGAAVNEGDTIEIEDVNSANLLVTDTPPFVLAITLYKHEGDDYRAVGAPFTPQLDGTGTYSLVVLESEPPVVSQANPWQQIKGWLIPTAHAQFGATVQVITFTITEPTEEIDPLLLQYAPILRMHEDEDYYPMQMEDFITDSALWDQGGIDEQLYDATTLTPELFTDVIATDDTSDYYLAYSDPNEAKSLDLDAARTKYGTPDPDDVTIYAHRMTDSDGEKDYIVLQYWQFYAMNNWEEVGGFNNHEGDFESVFIFLDAETEEPEYVAYSAHQNDGESEFLNPFQYDSVRRTWNNTEVTKEGGRVVSYVSQGSHANYPNNGNEGSHLVPNLASDVDIFDITSNSGIELFEQINLKSFGDPLLEYEGKWGADINDLLGGNSGPKGPQFLDVGGTIRFLNPVEWAGIDDISKITVSAPTAVFDFIESAVSMVFSAPVPAGTEFIITPYEEPITEGDVPEDATLLPTYWDLESTLENDTFEVDIAFSYDPAVVESLEGNEEDLAVFFYNPENDAWEPRLNSIVGPIESTVSFTNTTFSRYALGLLPQTEEPPTLEELFAQLKTEIKEADLPRGKEKRLLVAVHLAEKFSQRDKPVFERITKRTLNRVERIVNRYERRGHLNTDTVEEMIEVIEKIREILHP